MWQHCFYSWQWNTVWPIEQTELRTSSVLELPRENFSKTAEQAFCFMVTVWITFEGHHAGFEAAGSPQMCSKAEERGAEWKHTSVCVRQNTWKKEWQTTGTSGTLWFLKSTYSTVRTNDCSLQLCYEEAVLCPPCCPAFPVEEANREHAGKPWWTLTQGCLYVA